MRILKVSSKKAPVEHIPINGVYVKITDFGLISLLKEIIIGPGVHTWYWVTFKETEPISINPNHYKIISFDLTINKSVNDLYCTVYQFETYNEMIEKWKDIKYNQDNIKTVYKGKV